MTEETKQEAISTEKTTQDTKADMRGMVDQFEAFLDEHMVKNAPFHIPAGGKEFLVTIVPYFVIITAVLVIAAIVGSLGLMTAFGPFASMGMIGLYGGQPLLWISTILSAIVVFMEVSVLKGLRVRSHAAWKMMYYASLVSLASELVSFNIIGGIISSIIGWYILFQVKSLYTK